MAELQDILPFTKKLSLLYIEDDEQLVDTATAALSKIFARVESSDDGYNGLSHFKINKNDIVIMDCDVPNMSGALLARNIKNAQPDQKIIVTCKEMSQEMLLELINVGVDAFMLKPYKMSELLGHIERCSKVAFHKHKQEEMLARANTLKEQHESRIEELLAKDQKSKDELAYERKRLGRLLQKEKALEKEVAAMSEKASTFRMINETTGLASRHALQNELLKSGPKALVYINIDHFDLINSIYGMGQGNKVLKACAARLERFLPSNAKLYHITADEFAVLLLNPSASQESLLAQQILGMYKQAELEVDGHSHAISFSIGLDRGESPALFVQAKTASKEARYSGGNQHVVFNPKSEYIEQQRKNLFWIRVLNDALSNDRLETFYQPIMSNTDTTKERFEVLCRLRDNQNRLVEATHFIAAAAIGGMMSKITRIVIDKAFKFFSTNSYNFSINISRQDLLEEYLEEFLQYKCDRYGIMPSRVSLEVVEEATISHSQSVIDQMGRLRKAGFHVAVDDFGAEYSVFTRMLRLHADYIKIDSSYIRNVSTNAQDRMIVQNIVSFAKHAGIKTVAEHVDSEEVQQMVKKLGIDYSQGYFIGKPLPTIEG